MESRIIDKMDQLMSPVSGYDPKIEAYNASMEDRIKIEVAEVLKNCHLEKRVGREGEIWIDRTPILSTPPNSGNPNNNNQNKAKNVDETGRIRDKMMKPGFLHPPRIEVPNFMGEDPRSWIRKCNKFFTLHHVSDSLQMEIVEMYLEHIQG